MAPGKIRAGKRPVRPGQDFDAPSHRGMRAPTPRLREWNEMTDGVLRVAQLNAGSLLEPGWDERRHEIAAWLVRLDPDVVCLQEIWASEATGNTAGWIVERAAPGRWHWTFAGGRLGP